MSDNKEPDFVFKVAIIGDYAVGKTTLIGRFIQKKFISEYKPTLGVNLILKELELETKDGRKIRTNLVLWDIAGQEKYERVRQLYYKGCSAAMVVYDVTRVDSFHNVKEKWVKDYMDNVSGEPIFILVGNKDDLKEIKKVDDSEGEKLKDEINAFDFFTTSALTGDNVDEAFMNLVKKLLENAGVELA